MPEVTKQLVNADIAEERAASALNSEEFAIWWAGGLEKLTNKRELEEYFFSDPELISEKHDTHMSHEEYFDYIVKKNVLSIIKMRKYCAEKSISDVPSIPGLSFDERISSVARACFPQSSPLLLHATMFIPAILNNGNEEQQREWLPKAINMNGWIGTYAMTEMGHGTYIWGIETRADFDIKQQEFILNTPKLSAYKWWPGGMGQCVNKAILSAQLYINGKHCGLQQFLVPLRDEETHIPLPGVDIGEIGPKISFNGTNNGFLGLHNVRIPRTNMLMKYAQVFPSGEFVKNPVPRLIYSTMVHVRVGIVKDSAVSLLLASTISARYSVVRRQSPISANTAEPKILDHVAQQVKVIPHIAQGMLFHLAARKLWNTYMQFKQEMQSGDFTNMPQMYALTSALKAVCTLEAAEAIEILRRSCGGHGYLASANFGQIYGNVTAACTYEGDSTVLLLQTARFLMHMMKQRKLQHELPETVDYLNAIDAAIPKISAEQTGTDLMLSLSLIIEHATACLVQYAWQQQELNSQEFGKEQAANKTGVYLVKAAIEHAHCFLVRAALAESGKLHRTDCMYSAQLKLVVSQLLELYVIDTFLKQLSNILRFTATVSAVEIAIVEKRYEQLLTLLRPHIINVVDGFDFHDRTLNSTLGSYDGLAYERLMAEARKNPLNQQTVHPVFHSHLKPLMQGKL